MGRSPRTRASGESRFQRWRFSVATNPGALPQAAGEDAPSAQQSVSSVKRADGISEIEGKAAMGSGERVGKRQRVSKSRAIRGDPSTLEPFNPSTNHARRRPRYAAGKLTTFFLALMASAPFAAGKKVSSTYFLALATRSRLQLRSSLRLIFSRWLSIVLTLRLSE